VFSARKHAQIRRMLLKKIQEIASLARPRGCYHASAPIFVCGNKKPRSMV
jgi:hypothetical protein